MRKTNRSMVHRIPITKARINLGAVVRRVHLNREYFILEKDGIPIAGIMGADELEDYLEVRDPKVRGFIAASHKEYLEGKGRPADALLAALTKSKARRRRTK